MKYGFVLPRGDAKTAARFAVLAEESGWDGFFVWEPVWGIDAWVCLTAAAMRTTRIRLGTMLSPLPRMRPWEFASKTATLDNLSDGRVIVAVGLGAPDTGYASFGEEIDRRTRAELLDEGLEIVTGLWRGQPYEFKGKHYTVTPCDFVPPPPPMQRPGIPIWVVGVWGRQKSMARALRHDGLLPGMPPGGKPASPDFVREMRATIDAQRAPDARRYEIVIEGETPIGDLKALETAREIAAAGADWWIEGLWEIEGDDWDAAITARVTAGPPV